MTDAEPTDGRTDELRRLAGLGETNGLRRPGGLRGPIGAATLALAVSAAACDGTAGDAPRIPIGEPAERLGWPAGVAVQVDSGNAAFRAGEYARARRHYTAATRADPHVPAAWFGLYMAESALGNRAAAESALARAGDIAPAARIHHALPPVDSGGF